MVIDILDKILDRLIAYRHAKRQSRADLLREFAEPFFVDLGRIHEAYLAAFRAFRRDLADGVADVEEILRRVHEERLFTEAMRTRVRALAAESSEGKDVPEVSAFCNSVREYLTLPNNDYHLGDLHFAHFQRWFTEYMLVLSYLREGRFKTTRDQYLCWAVPPLPMLFALEDAAIESDLDRYKTDRRAAAVTLLDALVLCMEAQYGCACTAYAKARAAILR